MAIIQQPPAIHTAFNPAILNISSNNEEVLITVQYGNNSFERERDVFNGNATFDLSNIVNKLFNDNLHFIISNIVYIDNKLIVTYKVIVEDNTINLNAINAVAQIGESSDLTKKYGTFLTDFERIYKYQGYERVVTCIAFDEDTYVGFDDTILNESQPISGFPCICIRVQDNKSTLFISSSIKLEELRTNANEIIRTNAGDIIYISSNKIGAQRIIPIETRCIPHSPFYVKWLNQQGGYDYWMFSFRQIKKRKINNQSFFNPVIYNQEWAKGTQYLVDMEAIEEITVGASNINEKEYQALSKIAYSPLIEWYNESLDKWFTLQVKDGENEHDSRNKGQLVEFTFTLPKPQLQV